MPLAVVAKYLPLPNDIKYQGLTGTVWQGQVNQLQVNQLQLNNLRWQFDLFKMAINVRFGNPRTVEEISGHGWLTWRLAGFQLTNSTVRAPANYFAQFSPMPISQSAIKGRVILNVSDYVYQQPLCQQLAGELSWAKAAITLQQDINLEYLSSNLSCEDNQVVARFDGENKLGLQGDFVLDSPSKFNFDGYLKPDASLPAMVHQGMMFFGKADNKGRFKVKL